MNIGALDTRISVVTVTGYSINAYGERAADGLNLFSVWAQIERKPGAAMIIGNQEVTVATIIFNVRYSDQTVDIKPDDTIKIGSKSYNIISTHLVGRKDMIKITARHIES